MVKMVATDIDGTLLRSDQTVSDRTRRAVEAVEDAGLTFMLVTGRPPRWLAPVQEELDHHGIAICANGGVVLDLRTGEVLEVNAFAEDTAREVLGRVRDLAAGLGFGVEWADGFAHDPSYPRGLRQSESVPGAVHDVTDDDQFFDRPVVKLLVRTEDQGEALEDLAGRAVQATDGLATVTWSMGGLLEISAAGVNKASTLARFAQQRDADSGEVVAFGDMPNDLQMLSWAGRGVAVANAHPLILDAADEHTASNDEDGVARVLERLVG